MNKNNISVVWHKKIWWKGFILPLVFLLPSSYVFAQSDTAKSDIVVNFRIALNPSTGAIQFFQPNDTSLLISAPWPTADGYNYIGYILRTWISGLHANLNNTTNELWTLIKTGVNDGVTHFTDQTKNAIWEQWQILRDSIQLELHRALSSKDVQDYIWWHSRKQKLEALFYGTGSLCFLSCIVFMFWFVKNKKS
jgi:hypothetical protein